MAFPLWSFRADKLKFHDFLFPSPSNSRAQCFRESYWTTLCTDPTGFEQPTHTANTPDKQSSSTVQGFASYETLSTVQDTLQAWRCTQMLLTPCSSVLLEKPAVPRLVKIFPEFHGIRRVHNSPPLVPMDSVHTIPSTLRYNLMPFHAQLGLPSGLLPAVFTTQTLYTFVSRTCNMPHPTSPLSIYHAASCYLPLRMLNFVSWCTDQH